MSRFAYDCFMKLLKKNKIELMIIIDINLTFYFIINKYDYNVRFMLFYLSVLIFAVNKNKIKK
jgi:hypothetical protein